MNLAQNPTAVDTAALIASGDDKVNKRFEVDHNGNVTIQHAIGRPIPTSKFWVEILPAGSDNLGVKASNDAKWVDRVHRTLTNAWRNGVSGFVNFED
jgi:hypothetical protein